MCVCLQIDVTTRTGLEGDIPYSHPPFTFKHTHAHEHKHKHKHNYTHARAQARTTIKVRCTHKPSLHTAPIAVYEHTHHISIGEVKPCDLCVKVRMYMLIRGLCTDLEQGNSSRKASVHSTLAARTFSRASSSHLHPCMEHLLQHGHILRLRTNGACQPCGHHSIGRV